MSHAVVADDWIKLELLGEACKMGSVLDVGCGYGLWGFWLRGELGFKGRLTGLDVDPDFLDSWTTQNIYDQRVWINLEEEIPFTPENTFDMVICSHLLEHVSKQTGLELLEWFKQIAAEKVVLNLHYGDVRKQDPGKAHMSHISVWYPRELEEHGYRTRIVNYPVGRVATTFTRIYYASKNWLLGSQRPHGRQIVAWYEKTEQGAIQG